MRAARIALLAATAALLVSCAGGPGAFCAKDTECRTGLRCAISNGGRGVCAYPGTSTTRDARARDFRPADQRREAHPLEARPAEARPSEARPAEAGPADLRALDARPPDLRPSDLMSGG